MAFSPLLKIGYFLQLLRLFYSAISMPCQQPFDIWTIFVIYEDRYGDLIGTWNSGIDGEGL